MDTMIKTIEDLSLNAWPSHQMQLYDGWILRFFLFFIRTVQTVWSRLEPPHFLLIPKLITANPSTTVGELLQFSRSAHWFHPLFDKMLSRRGYVVQQTTEVMTMHLSSLTLPEPESFVSLSSFIPPSWIDSLFALKGTTNVMHKMIVPSMYRAIQKKPSVPQFRIREKL